MQTLLRVSHTCIHAHIQTKRDRHWNAHGSWGVTEKVSCAIRASGLKVELRAEAIGYRNFWLLW